MMVPTEISCPLLWGESSFKISFPQMKGGEEVYLDFTISWYGEIKGLFEVEEVNHSFVGGRGYLQGLRVKPVQNS